MHIKTCLSYVEACLSRDLEVLEELGGLWMLRKVLREPVAHPRDREEVGALLEVSEVVVAGTAAIELVGRGIVADVVVAVAVGH